MGRTPYVLTIRYASALLAVAGLLVAGQLLIQRALDRQLDDSHVVNIAGRQRMLSQRLCMLLFALDAAEAAADRGELARVADEWESAQHQLAGDARNSDAIRELFAALAPEHRAMLDAARSALAVAHGPYMAFATAARAHEASFLASMDRIVAEYAREARDRVVRLSRIELVLLALSLAVLALEGAFVFRPAVRGLRAYLAERDTAEAQKRRILEALPDRLLVVGSDGRCFDPRDPAVTPDPLPAEITDAIARRVPATFEHHGAADLEIRTVPFTDDGVLAVIRDTTETRRLEQQVLSISDREQQRFAQDLHDGLSQHLVGVGFLVRALERDASAAQRVQLAEIGSLLGEAVEQTRTLARGLYSHTLATEGLGSALRELAAQTERVYGIPCHVECGDVAVPAGVAAHLYRIAREAVVNAAKHAKATAIALALDRAADHVELVVRDDGIGIMAGAGEGMGLHLMEYRAKMIGAVIHVVAAEQKGTTVRCTVPA